MSKDWQRGSGYVDAPKITKELGVGKDGYQTGGVKIEAPNPTESITGNTYTTNGVLPNSSKLCYALISI